MPARVAAVSGHALSTQAPANNAKLTNEGARTAGGLENLGTQTSNTFTQVEDIKCIETVSVPAIVFFTFPSTFSVRFPFAYMSMLPPAEIE